MHLAKGPFGCQIRARTIVGSPKTHVHPTRYQFRLIRWSLICLIASILLARSVFFQWSAPSLAPLFSGHSREVLALDGRVHCAAIEKVPMEGKCAFVTDHCPTDSLLNYIIIYYCHVAPHGWLAVIGYQITCVLGLLMTFRLLSTTADQYFSPILTQMSKEFYLPPRLAGVTLMAWGNGAPDIFSSIAAVKNDEYLLALGGQLGAGMFIGTVVVACVLKAGDGASMRGALIRDVSSYALAVIATTAVIASGKVTVWKAALLLTLYVVFVAVVCAADILHITKSRVGIPFSDAGAIIEEEGDLEEGLLDTRDWLQDSPRELSFLPPLLVPGSAFGQSDRLDDQPGVAAIELQHSKQGSPRNDDDIGALPIFDESVFADARTAADVAEVSANILPARRAASVDWLAEDRRQVGRPLSPYSQGSTVSVESLRPHHRQNQSTRRSSGHTNSTADDISYQEMVHMPASEYRRLAWVALSDKPSFRWLNRTRLAGADQLRSDRLQSRASVDNSFLDTPKVRAAEEAATAASATAEPFSRQPEHGCQEEEEEEEEEAPCRVSATAGSGSQELPRDPHRSSLQEAESSEQAEYMSSHGQGLAWLLAVTTAMEWPLTLLRRATIPLIEQESYSRQWMLISIASCPVAVAVYWQISWSATIAAAVLGIAASVAAQRTTQGSQYVSRPPEWSCGSPLPVGAVVVALCGFAMACLWINAFANELVGLLQLFGVLARVPNLLLGLTVLAWGNSVPDLFTDVSMARTGYANMAATACFAGPLCNLLCGLGLGFLLSILRSTQAHISVVLPLSMATDAVIITFNCVLMLTLGLMNGGRLPAGAAAVFMILYGIYLAITLVVQFFH